MGENKILIIVLTVAIICWGGVLLMWVLYPNSVINPCQAQKEVMLSVCEAKQGDVCDTMQKAYVNCMRCEEEL